MALITVAEARAYIPGNSGTGDDTILGTLITRAEHELAAICGFPAASGTAGPTLEQATLTLYLDGPDATDPTVLLLPRPIVSITSIHDDPANGYGSGYEVASTNWRLDKPGGRVRLLATSTHAWSSAPEAIKVIGVFGLTTGAIPEYVKDACARLVRLKFQERHTAGLASVSIAGRSQQAGAMSVVEQVAPEMRIIQRLVAPLIMHEVRLSGATAWRVG